jgi:tetratricopeptide (TPR) repeat protein
MGTVFRAADLVTGSPVAIKVLAQHHSQASDRERFLREASILASLRHPGIVSHVDHGFCAPDVPFLVMEWLTGEDLASYLGRVRLSLAQSLTLARRVAEALATAHQHGVVHRDLEPSNLFLRHGELEDVVILDFGVARYQAHGPAVTGTGVVVGTPEYMAPEQARGQRHVGSSADVFSPGCVLFECLAGHPPFAAEHLTAVLAKILFEEAPRLRAVRPGASSALDALVGSMLAKDPRHRPADASVLARELRRLEGLDGADELLLARTVEMPGALTGREQALVSIVLASPPESLGGGGSLRRGVALAAPPSPLPLPAALALGGRVEQLADGSLVATMTAAGSATDLAVQAARYALALHERWPQAAIALTTGRGQLQASVPVGEAIDRAAQLLHAARALAANKPERGRARDGVSVDALTAGLLDQRFEIALERCPRGELRTLLGESAHKNSTRHLLGRPTPCVGREQELGLLESVLHTSIEESRSRAVLVVGPPGVGKTRLWHELLRRFQARQDLVNEGELLLGRGDPLASERPYGLLNQAVRRLCGAWSLSEPQALREALLRHIGDQLEPAAAAHVVTFLCEMCGISVAEDVDSELAAAHKDPQRMAEQIRLAFSDFVRARCAIRPVLFIAEDLHWADPQSVQILGDVLVELADQPLVVLGLARPQVRERFSGLWSGQVQEVPLRALGKKACERLIQHVLNIGNGDVDPALVARLTEQSAGNALYLEELIRATADGRSDVPETVLAMLQARIQPLAPELRRVLRAASVFGTTFWQGGVLALLGPGATSDELAHHVQALFSLEIIERQRVSRYPGEAQYGFRQGLLRDAVYGLLTDEDRQIGHLLAARYLEQSGETEPLVLIGHYERAGQPEQAFAHFQKAGDTARRLCLFAAAQQHYQHALAGLRKRSAQDPEPRPEQAQEAHRQRIDLIVKLVETMTVSDRRADLLPLLAEAEAALQALAAPEGAVLSRADEIRKAWIDYLAGRVHYFSGNPSESLRYYRKVLPIAQRSKKRELLAYPAALVGTALMNQGYADRAEHWLQQSLAPLEQIGDRWEWLRAMGYLGIAHAVQGRGKEGWAILAGMQQQAADNSHLTSLASGLTAACCLFTGETELAIVHARKVEALYDELKDPVHLFAAFCTAAWSLALEGEPVESRRYMAQAEALGRELGGRVVLFDWCLAGLAEAAAALGDRALTERLAEQVMVLALRLDSRLSLGIVERALGLVKALHGGADAEVDEPLLASRAAFREGQVRTQEAMTEAAWALVHKQRGDLMAEARFGSAVAQLGRYGCTRAVSYAEHCWRSGRPSALRTAVARAACVRSGSDGHSVQDAS